MSLEQDLVFQLKEQGLYSDEDILKTCKDYVNDSRVKLPITEEQAKKEIERYGLLEKYLQQTGNRRMLKRMFKKRIKEIIYKETQEILNEPEIISVKRIVVRPDIFNGWPIGGLNLCGDCLEPFGVRNVYAKGTKMEKMKNGRIRTYNFKYNFLIFCTRCQSISNEYGQMYDRDITKK